MSAIEFWTHVGPDRTLKVPDAVADQLEADQAVQVILLVPDPDEDADEDRAWARLGADQLLRAYADEDSVYDDIDPAAR